MHARAVENGVYLAASGYDYASEVVDPLGAALASVPIGAGPKAAVADIDLGKRFREDWLGDWRDIANKERRTGRTGTSCPEAADASPWRRRALDRARLLGRKPGGMPLARRRLLGALTAALVLLIAAGGTVLLRATRARELRAELAEATEGSRSRVQDAIRAQLAVVEGRAASGAANPVLRAQLGVVDAATLKDGFASESWWDAVRREFPISGVAAGDSPEVLVGLDPKTLDFSGVIKAARKAGQASALLSTPRGSPVLAGAAIAEGRAAAQYAVLVARPVDAAFVDQIAARTRGAALISDGKRALLAAGPAETQDHLKAAIGSEAAGTFAVPGWAVAATPLASGLWVWSELRLRPVQAGLPLDLIAVWAVAGLAVAGALAFALRRAPTRAPQGELEPATVPSAHEAGIASDPARAIRSNPGQTGNTRRTNPGNRGTDSGSNRRAVHPLARPNQFGRYLLVDRLGEGGMAEVYTAVTFGAEGFRRTFVVKRLRAELARSTDAGRRSSSTRRSSARRWCTRTSCRCSTSARSATSTSWRRSTSSAATCGRLVAARDREGRQPLARRPRSLYIVHETLEALEYAHTSIERRRAGRWASSTATSRPATSWCRRAAR